MMDWSFRSRFFCAKGAASFSRALGSTPFALLTITSEFGC
jgi:hypothetical protein